jgi:acyl dehydratase
MADAPVSASTFVQCVHALPDRPMHKYFPSNPNNCSFIHSVVAVQVNGADYLTTEWDTIPVSYNRRDLITYAVGIGCTELPFIYELNPAFAAFPTYPIVLAFKGAEQDVVAFPPPAMKVPTVLLPGTIAGLDGERYIEQVNQIPAQGAELMLRSKTIGVHKKGSGAIVENLSEIFDGNTGTIYTKMVSGFFLVGASGFTDAGETYSVSVKPPARDPDHVVEEATSQFQAQIYRLSGDYNPLHVDPAFAKAVGFEGPILHGLCSLGVASRALLTTYCNNNAALFKSVKLRFAAPVLPGQTLVTSMWTEGGKVIFNVAVKETGKVSGLTSSSTKFSADSVVYMQS